MVAVPIRPLVELDGRRAEGRDEYVRTTVAEDVEEGGEEGSGSGTLWAFARPDELFVPGAVFGGGGPGFGHCCSEVLRC